MKRATFVLFTLVLTLLLCAPASAVPGVASYIIPGNPPPGITGNGMSYTLPADATIPQTAMVTVLEGASLTIPQGVTLTMGGSLYVNGSLDNQGVIRFTDSKNSVFLSCEYSGARITNAPSGRIVVDHKGRISCGTGATFDNQGEIRLSTNNNLYNDMPLDPGAPRSTFINNGTIAADGALIMRNTRGDFINNGKITLNNGSVLQNGGDGALMTNNGTIIGGVLGFHTARFVNSPGALLDTSFKLTYCSDASVLDNQGDMRNIGGEIAIHDNGKFTGRFRYATFDAGGGKLGSGFERRQLVPMEGATANLYLAYLPTPTRKGYEFLGWSANGGEPEKDVLRFATDTTFVAQWKSDAPPEAGQTVPEITGQNQLSGAKGKWKGQKIQLRLAGASFKKGGALPVTVKIGAQKKTVKLTANGSAKASFTAAQLNKLKPGRYDILATAAGNATNLPIPETFLGTLSVGEAPPSAWQLPGAAKITKGFSRQLPTTRLAALPALSYSVDNPAVLSVDSNGVASGLSAGSCVVTVKDADGATLSCAVSVAPNAYSVAKPRKLSKKGVFASTKSLKYEGGKLVVEVYLYNASGKAVTSLSGVELVLYKKADRLITLAQPEAQLPGTLKHKGAATLRFEIDQTQLSGTLDLANGRIEAGLTGTAGTSPIRSLLPANAVGKRIG